MKTRNSYSHEDAVKIIKNERAVVRTLVSNNGDDHHWHFLLKQFQDPENNRPIRELSQNADRRHVIELDASKPNVNQWTTRLIKGERGRAKPGKKEIKKISCSLLPIDGRMRLYNHSQSNKNHLHCIIGFDLEEGCIAKAFFQYDAGTNTKFWVQGQELNSFHTGWPYFGAPKAISLSELRKHNKEHYDKLQKGGARHHHERNEVLIKPSVDSIRFIAAVENQRLDRLNALHKKYLVQQDLKINGIPLDVAVLVISSETGVHEYNQQAQIHDIIQASSSEEKALANKIIEQLIVLEYEAKHLALNFQQQIDNNQYNIYLLERKIKELSSRTLSSWDQVETFLYDNVADEKSNFTHAEQYALLRDVLEKSKNAGNLANLETYLSDEITNLKSKNNNFLQQQQDFTSQLIIYQKQLLSIKTSLIETDQKHVKGNAHYLLLQVWDKPGYGLSPIDYTFHPASAYSSYLKATHQLPSEDSLRKFIIYVNSLKQVITSPKSPKLQMTGEVKDALAARKIWSEVVSAMDLANAKFAKQDNIEASIMQRLQNLGFTSNLQAIYQGCLHLLQNHTALVLTFDANFLGQNEFNLHSPLNIFERKNKGEKYLQNREQAELAMFQPVAHVEPKIYQALANNKKAFPRYAALMFIDEKNHIKNFSTYGKSYVVLNDAIKLNSLYVPDSPVNASTKKITYKPASFMHMQVLLHQLSDKYLKIIADWYVTGEVDKTYKALEYIEVLIPAVNILDKNVTQHIHIDDREYNLTESHKSLLQDQGFSVSTSKAIVNPYQEFANNYKLAIKSDDIKRVKSLLKSYPSVKYMLSGLGFYEAVTAANEEIFNYLLATTSRQDLLIEKNNIVTICLSEGRLDFLKKYQEHVAIKYEANSYILGHIDLTLTKAIQHGKTAVFSDILNFFSANSSSFQEYFSEKADKKSAQANGYVPYSLIDALRINVNDKVIVVDTANHPLSATVLDVNNKQIFIHYEGWSSKWNEWIDIKSGLSRLFYSQTPASNDVNRADQLLILALADSSLFFVKELLKHNFIKKLLSKDTVENIVKHKPELSDLFEIEISSSLELMEEMMYLIKQDSKIRALNLYNKYVTQFPLADNQIESILMDLFTRNDKDNTIFLDSLLKNTNKNKLKFANSNLLNLIIQYDLVFKTCCVKNLLSCSIWPGSVLGQAMHDWLFDLRSSSISFVMDILNHAKPDLKVEYLKDRNKKNLLLSAAQCVPELILPLLQYDNSFTDKELGEVLVYLVRLGYKKHVMDLIKFKPTISLSELDQGATPLIIAITSLSEMANADTIQSLCRKTDVQFTDRNGKSALYYAVEKNPALIDVLLNSATFDDKQLIHALHLYLSQNIRHDAAIVAKMMPKDNKLVTSNFLTSAVWSSSYAELLPILLTADFSPIEITKALQTLHTKHANVNLACTQLLCKKAGMLDANLGASFFNELLLKKDFTTIKLLVNHLDITDGLITTHVLKYLHSAVKNNDVSAIEGIYSLINLAANKSFYLNQSALVEQAVDLGFYNLALLLVLKGFDSSSLALREKLTRNFIISCQAGKIGEINNILQLKSHINFDINGKDGAGNSALHYIAIQNQPEQFINLLALGADMLASNAQQKTAFEIYMDAYLSQHQDIYILENLLNFWQDFSKNEAKFIDADKLNQCYRIFHRRFLSSKKMPSISNAIQFEQAIPDIADLLIRKNWQAAVQLMRRAKLGNANAYCYSYPLWGNRNTFLNQEWNHDLNRAATEELDVAKAAIRFKHGNTNKAENMQDMLLICKNLQQLAADNLPQFIKQARGQLEQYTELASQRIDTIATSLKQGNDLIIDDKYRLTESVSDLVQIQFLNTVLDQREISDIALLKNRLAIDNAIQQGAGLLEEPIYTLTERQFKKALEIYHKNKHHICGKALFQSVESRDAIEQMETANNDEERYQIAKQYMVTNPDKTFAQALAVVTQTSMDTSKVEAAVNSYKNYKGRFFRSIKPMSDETRQALDKLSTAKSDEQRLLIVDQYIKENPGKAFAQALQMVRKCGLN